MSPSSLGLAKSSSGERELNLYEILQIVILILGVTVVWLLSCKSPYLRLVGFIVGGLGQPCWFYVTWCSGQWGIFALSWFYLLFYLNGVRNSIHLIREGPHSSVG